MVMASVLNFHRLTVEFVQGDADFRLDGVSGGVSLQMFFRFLLLLFDLLVESLHFHGEEIQLFVVVDLNHRRVRLHTMPKILDQTLDVARLVDQVGSSFSDCAEDTRLTGDSSDGCRPAWTDRGSSRCEETIPRRESNRSC